MTLSFSPLLIFMSYCALNRRFIRVNRIDPWGCERLASVYLEHGHSKTLSPRCPAPCALALPQVELELERPTAPCLDSRVLSSGCSHLRLRS